MSEWNDIAVLAPTGDIDISTVPALRRRIESLRRDGVRRIIVNCDGVSFIDSTGVAFLLSVARELFAAHGLLSMVDVSPNVMRFLQIACLADPLHASSSERLPVPVLAPGASPKWSKSFTVAEGIEHLAGYRHRVAELLADLPMGENDRYDCALAVGEALGNAYDHADGARGCTCTLSAYDDRVVCVLRDCGAGYELSDDEAPKVSEARGRGIRLMRMLVDNVEVKRREDRSGTVVRLVKLF